MFFTVSYTVLHCSLAQIHSSIILYINQHYPCVLCSCKSLVTTLLHKTVTNYWSSNKPCAMITTIVSGNVYYCLVTFWGRKNRRENFSEEWEQLLSTLHAHDPNSMWLLICYKANATFNSLRQICIVHILNLMLIGFYPNISEYN